MKAKIIHVTTTSSGVFVRHGLADLRPRIFASMDQAMAAIQTRGNHGRQVLIDGQPTFVNAWIS